MPSLSWAGLAPRYERIYKLIGEQSPEVDPPVMTVCFTRIPFLWVQIPCKEKLPGHKPNIKVQEIV